LNLLPWTKATPSVIVFNTRQILTQGKSFIFKTHKSKRG
jgi:hypothetical protein